MPISIARAVEKLLSEKPFLEEAMSRGLINYTALAAFLKKEIEHELKREVKISAIGMALRRFEETNKAVQNEPKFGKDCDVTIRSGLMEITILKKPASFESIKKLYEIVDFERGDFLSIIQGLFEIAVISNSKHEKELLKMLEKEKKIKILKGLASVTLKISESAVETPSLFYLATKALNWENVNIVEIISTLTEMTFIIEENEAPKAFKVLKDLIERE
jgi:aspartokinase